MLSVSHLVKHYGKIHALKGVSFEVPEGSVFGILGPNGSGKTTLLSIVLGVLSADAGNYEWFGQTASPALRKQIGSLLETPNFYHYLSAVNNLKITQSISGRGDLSAIEKVLQQVNLFERRNSKFSSYSLGIEQRLAIAAALLGDPKILVLDEPTNGLDPVGIAEIRSLILALRDKGHTIIMASHLLDEVEKVCSHVAILKTGTLVACGAVQDVLAQEDMVELAASDLQQLAALLQNMPGVQSVSVSAQSISISLPRGSARLDEINRYCFDNGMVLTHLMLKRKRLEEKFFELTHT
ncbi:MAG: ATP-binding cassette domain-containing protein [Bacteroidetes bacterium]|nr:ATP-binding cassette domain-containing protein [Bacteroidota bacterium]